VASRESVFLLGIAFLAAGCKNEQPSPLYEKVSVERRDLSVTVSAAGTIEPVLTVDVKSKASGEIIEMNVETGDDVQTGRLLARIDPRVQRNTLLQAQANLEVAQARLQNAETQKRRADELFAKQGIAETEHETAILAWATAKADVVRVESDLETARDQMEDTSVKAPIRGTILVKSAELGTVISSPTRDVGGGSVLFRMANLDTMQVRALVDETDIGKIQAGAEASLRVDAYPSRSFQGRVYKIEPQALVQQNVTMFPVIIGIRNPGHLLRPGMNTDVELDVGERQNVLTIPNAALRTPRDVASAAQVLGLDPEQVQEQLAAAQKAAADQASAAHNGDDERTASAGRTDAAEAVAKAGAGDPVAKTAATMTLPNGREITLPAGVRAEDVRAAMQKRFSGGDLSPEEQALLRRVFSSMGGGKGGMGGGGGGGGGGGMRGGMRGSRPGAFGGSYIVFALHHGRPEPVEIETGLTDLDHIEVTRGLSEQDTVLVLPSASLVNGQKEFRDRLQRMQGGGGLPGMQQQQQPPRPGSTGTTTSGGTRPQAR
jgi:HlyD family secretion protein